LAASLLLTFDLAIKEKKTRRRERKIGRKKRKRKKNNNLLLLKEIYRNQDAKERGS